MVTRVCLCVYLTDPQQRPNSLMRQRVSTKLGIHRQGVTYQDSTLAQFLSYNNGWIQAYILLGLYMQVSDLSMKVRTVCWLS